MRQKEIHIDPVDADADGLAAAQAIAGALPLVLNGVLIEDSFFTGDYARKIGILSAGDDSLVTFTIVGTDADGKSQTEGLAGSAAAPGTAESVLYYKTVTSITTDGATTGNVSAGTVDEFVTNTIPLETHNGDPATISFERFAGVIDVSVEQSKSRIQYTDVIVFYAGPSSLQGQTSQSTDDIDNHASAVRLKCNSYTSGGELRMIINQDRQY